MDDALDEEQILENPKNYSLGIEVLKQRFHQPPLFGKTDRTTNNRRNKTREKPLDKESTAKRSSRSTNQSWLI